MIAIAGFRNEYNCREFKRDAPYVKIEGGILQGNAVFISDPVVWDGIRAEADRHGVVWFSYEDGLRRFLPTGTQICVERSGVWEGYGHGYKEVVARSPSGDLIIKMSEVAHCDGPGYRCSYPHGPWYEYAEEST